MEIVESFAVTYLINALWQVPAVVLAASLGDVLLRRAPARLRHALWLAALLLGVLLPAISLMPAGPLDVRDPSSAAVPEEVLATDGSRTSSRTSTSAFRPQAALAWPSVRSTLALLFGACLIGSAFRLGRSWWKARALARSAWAPALSEPTAALLARCRQAFDLAEVDVLCSDQVAGPVTLGAFRPAVLLPARFLAEASPDELTSTFGHELAHVRRRDYAVHLLGEMLLVPIAFHPAVRRLRRRLAETREMACDEATVERLIAARSYARSLLSLAASFAGLPRPVFTLGVHHADADTLEERMKRLTDPRSRLGARAALASLSLALLLLAGTSLGASAMAVRAPGDSSPKSAGAWAPFLGLWHTEFPDKEGRKLPGSDLEIRLTNGQPEAILTMYRHRKNPDGSVRTDEFAIPAYDLRIEGNSLTYRFRTAMQYRDGDPKVVLEHTNRLELTGEGEGVIRSLGGKSAADPKQIPPPPPPQTAKRLH